jgi:hypothetical protein
MHSLCDQTFALPLDWLNTANFLETATQSLIPPEAGIMFNPLCTNPRQFGFQLLLWQEMRRKGLPMEGFCVAA